MYEVPAHVEREQIDGSTAAQLADRLKALHERYEAPVGAPHPWLYGYPLPQLRELHAIEDELERRAAPRANAKAQQPAQTSEESHDKKERDSNV